MARITLMLLEGSFHVKFLFAMSTLKRMIGFIVLLKSTIIDKVSIARGAEAMLRSLLMLLHGKHIAE